MEHEEILCRMADLYRQGKENIEAKMDEISYKAETIKIISIVNAILMFALFALIVGALL